MLDHAANQAKEDILAAKRAAATAAFDEDVKPAANAVLESHVPTQATVGPMQTNSDDEDHFDEDDFKDARDRLDADAAGNQGLAEQLFREGVAQQEPSVARP